MHITLIMPSYQRLFYHMFSYICRVSLQIIRGNTHTCDYAETRKLQPQISVLETPPTVGCLQHPDLFARLLDCCFQPWRQDSSGRYGGGPQNEHQLLH